MIYNAPLMSRVATVENKVQAADKNGASCQDRGVGPSSNGAYEVDE